MNYYNMPTLNYAGKTYSAWSFVQCRKTHNHEPHVWDSEFIVYGPYLCKGESDATDSYQI